MKKGPNTNDLFKTKQSFSRRSQALNLFLMVRKQLYVLLLESFLSSFRTSKVSNSYIVGSSAAISTFF
jgi:hypothetical protein